MYIHIHIHIYVYNTLTHTHTHTQGFSRDFTHTHTHISQAARVNGYAAGSISAAIETSVLSSSSGNPPHTHTFTRHTLFLMRALSFSPTGHVDLRISGDCAVILRRILDSEALVQALYISS